jgi:hypothetical protein
LTIVISNQEKVIGGNVPDLNTFFSWKSKTASPIPTTFGLEKTPLVHFCSLWDAFPGVKTFSRHNLLKIAVYFSQKGSTSPEVATSFQEAEFYNLRCLKSGRICLQNPLYA